MKNQKISNSEDTSNSSTQHSNSDIDAQDNSRFSRRRLLQVGIASSPLLLSIKSPVTWAGGGLEGCSISALGSINASNVNSDNCSNGALSPGYWYGVFSKENSKKNRTKAGVYEEIVKRGASNSTDFINTFVTPSVISHLNTLNSINKNWKISLSNNSPNYDFGEILATGNNNKLNLYLTFTNKVENRIVSINITEKVPNVHKFVVTGYLNTLFPGIIDYITPTELMDWFVTALSQSSNSIISKLDSPSGSHYSGLVRNMPYNYDAFTYLVSSSGLNRWD